MKALIMAAGDGIRLRPFTETRPKVLLPVAGKPVLHHILTQARKAGITEAIIVVRHMKEKIMGYLSDKQIQTEIGMKINFLEQNAENGTAQAIATAS